MTTIRQRPAMTRGPSLRDMTLGRDGGLLAPGEKSPVDQSRRNSRRAFGSIRRPSIKDGMVDAAQTQESSLGATVISTHRNQPKKDPLAFFRKAFSCFKKAPIPESEGNTRTVTLDRTCGYGAAETEITDPPERGSARDRVLRGALYNPKDFNPNVPKEPASPFYGNWDPALGGA